MVIALLISSILLCGYSVIRFSGRIGIIKAVIMSIISLFFSHVVLSGILFWIEQYSILTTLKLCAGFWAAAALILTVIIKKKIEIRFSISNEIIPIVIVLCVLPFIINKFEFFGIKRDEGVYQTQAICFMYGMTDRQIDIEEYHLIEDEELRQSFKDAVSQNNLLGFYNYSSMTFLPTAPEENTISEVSGLFHGIPTYSALMALWGSIFGIENMSQINTVLFICSIFLMGYICTALKINKPGKAVALALYAFTPLAIWVSKSSLTETGLIVIWMMYFYLLIKYKEDKRVLLSAICIMVYSFYHLSVYAFMPMFVILYVWLYGLTKNKYNIYSVIFSVAAFLTGFWFMYTVEPIYTANNFKPIFHMGINIYNVHCVITAVCCICLAATLVFLYFERGRLGLEITNKRLIVTEKFIYIGVAVLSVAGTIYYYISYNFIPQQLSNLTLIAYFIVAGIIIPLIVFIHTLLKTDTWLNNMDKSILLWIFMYCVLIYSLLFRTTTAYYYYYARYIVMFIPFILLMGIIILQGKYVTISAAVGIITLIFSLRYDCVMLKGKDATIMEWDVLLSIAEQLDEDDALVIPQEDFGFYYFPLKVMSGVDIYHMAGNVEEELTELDKKYDDLYFIARSEEVFNNVFLIPKVIIPYTYSRDHNTYYGDYTSSLHEDCMPYPTAFYTEERKAYLLKHNKVASNTLYFASAKEIKSEGFDFDEDGARWSNSEDCKTVINIEKGSYNIHFYIWVPFSDVSFKERTLTIRLNGKEVAAINLNEDKCTIPVTISVDESEVNNGVNTIEYSFDLWSPSVEYDSPDKRWLGFRLLGIMVEPTIDYE